MIWLSDQPVRPRDCCSLRAQARPNRCVSVNNSVMWLLFIEFFYFSVGLLYFHFSFFNVKYIFMVLIDSNILLSYLFS